MTWLFDRCTDQFKIFSSFLAKAEVDFWCIHARHKKTREMDTTFSKRHRSCGIGISSILETVFRYLPILRTALRYWVSPDVPLLERLAIALR